MKNSKKLLSTLLALVMVFCLAIPAFAAGTGKITVADAGEYAYKGYKIFDAVKDGTDAVYTIDGESVWFDVVKDFSGLEFVDNGSGVYTVKKLNNFSAADFAEHLKANIPDGAAAVDFVDAVASDLDFGYYLVVSSDDDFASMQDRAALATVLDDKVTIQNKNDMPFEKQVKDNEDDSWVKEDDVQVGDVVDFQLLGKVSDTTNDDVYFYFVNDKLDAGLTFDKDSIVVKVNGAAVEMEEVSDPDALLTGDQIRFGQNGYTFELSLEMLERGKTLAGKDIVISYSATVNEDALSVVSENNASLIYGNDPSNPIVKDSMTKTYTSLIQVDKFETGAPEQKLAGAQFVLKNAEGKFYHYEDSVVSWVEAQDEASVVKTDTNGVAQFVGLLDGNYQLVEIKAPDGYTLLTAPVDVSIDGSVATAVGLTDAQITQALTNVSSISNTPGSFLPSTGGIGTTMFYIIGAILVIGAGAYLVLRKRPAKSEN